MKEKITLAATDEAARRKGFIRLQRPLTAAEQAKGKIGRNAPCICDSGLKFKKCCGKS